MSVNIPQFLEAAALAARQVGVVARRLQGQVANEGKETQGHANDDDYMRRVRGAKTAVDEIAQDIIITALAPHLPIENTLLDGEEETPGKALLPATSGDYVLVIDPIDGTLNYVEGGDMYSINIGLLHKGKVAAALMYYAALDVAWWTPGKGAFCAHNFALNGMRGAQEVKLAAQPLSPQDVYIYHDVEKPVAAAIRDAGFTHIRDFRLKPGADPVTGMFEGRVSAAVLEHIQVRDIIHGAILSCAEGGYLCDWQGNPISWPLRGGALPKCLVSGWPLSARLKSVLQGYAA